MTSLRFGDGVAEDIERIAEHWRAYQIEGVQERLAEILDALELLKQHPNIGRPAGSLHRVLIIGQGSRGYVARYWYDPLDDAVEVLALRAQREAGFRDV